MLSLLIDSSFFQVARLIYQNKLLKSTLFLNFFLIRYVGLAYAFKVYQQIFPVFLF